MPDGTSDARHAPLTGQSPERLAPVALLVGVLGVLAAEGVRRWRRRSARPPAPPPAPSAPPEPARDAVLPADADALAPPHGEMLMRRLALRTLMMVLVALLLAGGMAFALGRGAVDIPMREVFETLRDKESGSRLAQVIIHQQRLPRALVAALVGINLAVAGTMLQGAVRSPLADPYIIGVSAGGGLTGAYMSLQQTSYTAHTVPLAALVGSLVGALLVYAVAWDGTGVTTTRLALAGVAITAMFSAFTTTIVVMSVHGGGQIIFQWLVGGLYTVGWSQYYLIAPYTLVGLAAAMVLTNRANVLALGDDVAKGLGLRVAWTRFLMAVVAAVLAGSSVAVAGLIGFVGLLVPYIARRLVGSDFRYLVPCGLILGAALMVWADAASRVTFPRLIGTPDVEIPVGIVTAVLGGPLFLWLVRARRTQW